MQGSVTSPSLNVVLGDNRGKGQQRGDLGEQELACTSSTGRDVSPARAEAHPRNLQEPAGTCPFGDRTPGPRTEGTGTEGGHREDGLPMHGVHAAASRAWARAGGTRCFTPICTGRHPGSQRCPRAIRTQTQVQGPLLLWLSWLSELLPTATCGNFHFLLLFSQKKVQVQGNNHLLQNFMNQQIRSH